MVMCFGVAQKQKGVADAMIEAENSPLGGRGKFKRPLPPAECAHPLLPLVPALGGSPHAPGRAPCQGAPVLQAPPGTASRHWSARSWPAYRQQEAAIRLMRGERLIQKGNIALLDNPSDNLHHMLLPTIALGLPWATLLTQLAWVSLLASDAVNDRLQALGPLSTALRRALNTVGISVVAVPVLANKGLGLRYYLRKQALSLTVHCYGNILKTYRET